MFSRFTLTFALIAGSGVLGLPVRAWAQSNGSCHQCGGPCEHCKLVPCQIMVPALVVERRMKTCIVKEQVEREEKYTAFETVPVTRKTYKEHCYLEHDVKTKTITQQQCHLVECNVEKTFTATTYHPEMRNVTTKNCDGSCQTQPCEVMIPTPEKCTKSWTELKVAMETITKDIDYCVMVPKKETVVCGEEKTCELKPVERTRKVIVCVPKVVKVPEEVLVRKMIPKTIYCCPSCAKHHH